MTQRKKLHIYNMIIKYKKRTNDRKTQINQKQNTCMYKKKITNKGVMLNHHNMTFS